MSFTTESYPSSLLQQEKRKVKVLVTQSCLTLCDPMDCSPSDSSVHGILQAGILEWSAISFPWGLPKPGVKHSSPCTAGRLFIH